jgi:single-strand DNA-binding protein
MDRKGRVPLVLNRIVLIGRLTQDPELRYTASGTGVCTFTLAVDRQRPNQMGERETDFINIVVWQKLGELCAQYLRKGRLAAVEGRLQVRTYENKEGQRVRVAEVVADNVRFLDRADREGALGGGAPAMPGREPQRETVEAEDPFAEDAKPIDIMEDDLPF